MARKFINFTLHGAPQIGEAAFLVGYIGSGEIRMPLDSLSGIFALTGAAGGGVSSAANLGAGSGIYKNLAGGSLNFYSLAGGGNISIIQSGDTYFISSPSPAFEWGDISGFLEDQTDLDVALSGKLGTGEFSGHELLTSGAHGISSFGSSLAGAIDQSAALSALGISNYIDSGTNVGGGSGIVKQAAAHSLEFYSFIAGSYITIVQSGDSYILSSTASGGGAATWGSIGGTLSSQADLALALGAKATTGDLAALSGDFTNHTSLTSGAHGITNYGANFTTATGNGQINSLLGLGSAAFQNSSYFGLASDLTTVQNSYITGGFAQGTGYNIFDSVSGKDLLFQSLVASGDIEIFSNGGNIYIGHTPSIGGGSAVDSVFGRSGVVAAQSGDYNAQQISYTGVAPTGYIATDGSVHGHLRGIDASILGLQAVSGLGGGSVSGVLYAPQTITASQQDQAKSNIAVKDMLIVEVFSPGGGYSPGTYYGIGIPKKCKLHKISAQALNASGAALNKFSIIVKFGGIGILNSYLENSAGSTDPWVHSTDINTTAFPGSILDINYVAGIQVEIVEDGSSGSFTTPLGLQIFLEVEWLEN